VAKKPPTEYVVAISIGTPAEVEAEMALKLIEAAAIIAVNITALSTRIHDAAYDRNLAADRVAAIIVYTRGTVEIP